MLRLKTLSFAAAATLVAGLAMAQQPSMKIASATVARVATDSVKPDSAKKDPKINPQSVTLYRPAEIDHIRPADIRGLNIFEPPKQSTVPFTGFALSLGGAFTQEFQGLDHTNAALSALTNGVNANQLIAIGHGFNNAVANLNVNAQIAPGIRVAMTSYLSARHHQESWVKDGYFLMDESPIHTALLDALMKNVTLKVGHFEIDYGDDHARRSDNGNSMYNPFIGNSILEAFTTEIGGEVFYRPGDLIAMFGVTGGEVHGQVTAPGARSASVLGKLGFDTKLDEGVRVRLTGSFYSNNKSASNTLFTGDRGGSPFYDVLENTASTETTNAWSGEIRPGFSNKVNAEILNPFVKIGGLEYFGSYETARGGAFTEPKLRNLRQFSSDLLYRFGGGERFYGGARYLTLNGQMLPRVYTDQNVNRWELGGGWFVTPNVLAKAEWVTQEYNNFPSNNIYNGGKFNGFMIAGAVGF
ncbi:MAG TPA: hypothetical protein VN706_16910 [Gemmatimonadaceae bacterium]|nr:hypothetical protein [Gemmatimonadaceae bacterium]